MAIPRSSAVNSKAAIAGHPLHPMLIVVPLGLLPAAFLADLVFHATQDAFWARAAFWLTLGGIAGGLVAGVAGFLDWKELPAGSRPRQIGAAHAIANLLLLAAFGVSLALRFGNPAAAPLTATVFAGVGLLLGGLGGWLGGELVFRHRVGVHER